MTDELPSTKKQAELIDLAARLDNYGLKMLGSEAHELSQQATRILSTQGAAMTLTLRVDEDAVCVELAASSARGGRVVVAAHSTVRQAKAEL